MDDNFKDNCSSSSCQEDETTAGDTALLIGGFRQNKKRCIARHISVVSLIAGTLWFMGAVVLLFARRLNPASDRYMNSQVTYSPAQEAVRYHKVWFTDGVNSRTKYMGSNAEVDEAWRNEYCVLDPRAKDDTQNFIAHADNLEFIAFGLVRISKEQAAQLPAQTSQIPGDTDHYIVGLEVFHQLHCLNGIRKALDPEHYNLTMETIVPENRIQQKAHLEHCVELLRQAVMCHSDISLNIFSWSPIKQKTLPVSEAMHSCRDFDAIKQWSLEHQLLEPLDEGQHLELSPPNEHTFNGYY